MRRLIAITLFAAFVLPFVVPLLAVGQGADAGLPICCRKNGKHRCATTVAEHMQMAAMESESSSGKQWRAPVEHCPNSPAAVVSYHASGSFILTAQVDFIAFFSDPVRTAQTECRWRIARDRSRQKRGPPAMSLA